MATTSRVRTQPTSDRGGDRPRHLDDDGAQLRRRLRRDDVGHQPEPRGHPLLAHPGHAQGGRAQPGDRLRERRGVHAGLVRRRGGQARPVRARRRGLDPQREDQRRGSLGGDGHRSLDRPADHHQRVGRPAGAEGGCRGCARDVRNLRRHPRDEEQPDRRDGAARLPRLEVEVEGRPARGLHPGLPGAAGQHHRDADVPRVPPRGHGSRP